MAWTSFALGFPLMDTRYQTAGPSTRNAKLSNRWTACSRSGRGRRESECVCVCQRESERKREREELFDVTSSTMRSLMASASVVIYAQHSKQGSTTLQKCGTVPRRSLI